MKSKVPITYSHPIKRTKAPEEIERDFLIIGAGFPGRQTFFNIPHLGVQNEQIDKKTGPPYGNYRTQIHKLLIHILFLLMNIIVVPFDFYILKHHISAISTRPIRLV